MASERNGEELSSYFSSVRVIQRMAGEGGFTDGGDETVRVAIVAEETDEVMENVPVENRGWQRHTSIFDVDGRINYQI